MSQVVYIKRNQDGKIIALCEEGNENVEQLPFEHPEVLEFLGRCEGSEKLRLIQSDLQLIRVLEDLIDVLISKNVITITDFPQSVIDKLLARQSIRKRISGAIGMEFGDEQ